jgi:hypothetical protein
VLSRASIDLDQSIQLRSCYTASMEADEHLPGEPARHTGRYDELNVFGTHTGRTIDAERGERLPWLPHGFTWRHIPECE